MEQASYEQLIEEGRYPEEVRRFVPMYEDMAKLILWRLIAHKKQYQTLRVLDLGCGEGYVDEMVLKSIPDCQVSAIDSLEVMANKCLDRLKPFVLDEKAIVVCRDMLDIDPDYNPDAIVSNLAIHNVPLDHKRTLLKNLYCWLKDDGIFLWGDLTRYDDPHLQSFWLEYRKEKARDAGAEEQFILENFEQEANDHMLTLDEELSMLREAGFKQAAPLLVFGQTALVEARK